LRAAAARSRRFGTRSIANPARASPPSCAGTDGRCSASFAIRAEAQTGLVAIIVADTGSGIPPEDIAHVTEPFYRAGDVYTSGAAGGAGLGLSIASGLVEAHGGSLAIASEVGKGTTVTLRFPVALLAP